MTKPTGIALTTLSKALQSTQGESLRDMLLTMLQFVMALILPNPSPQLETR